MYKLQEIVEAILKKEPIKKIARLSKVSKNTIRKYKKILDKSQHRYKFSGFHRNKLSAF